MWECLKTLGLVCNGRLGLCSALPCGVGSRGGGGSCGFASEVKEVVAQKISKAASCVWFSPLQPGLAELTSPAKFSQQGPERIFFLPCLGPQAQQGAPRRICGWKHFTAMQGHVAKKTKWRNRGGDMAGFFSCGLFPYLMVEIRVWKIPASTLQQPETGFSWV